MISHALNNQPYYYSDAAPENVSTKSPFRLHACRHFNSRDGLTMFGPLMPHPTNSIGGYASHLFVGRPPYLSILIDRAQAGPTFLRPSLEKNVIQ